MGSLKERLGFVETVYVGVGLDRTRMRPAPGTMIVELVDSGGNTLAVDMLAVDEPASPSPVRFNGKPATYVKVGKTGFRHQSFSYALDEPAPIDLPEHLKAKAQIGARRVNVWWSCETK